MENKDQTHSNKLTRVGTKMANENIPTVDLSPFFTNGDEDGKRRAKEKISQASSEYGFFNVVNHGVPLALINQAMKLSKMFFDTPDEEKLKIFVLRLGWLSPAVPMWIS
ncbi:unnamed protein product [Ilex paraguariensis]|uniref:Non-haem dioxygenase N-terminal domain-containing protein n=1 Tax=Ilex paraguariensis TaxID=185542 RepID=A0ABC8QZS1_9AQUA